MIDLHARRRLQVALLVTLGTSPAPPPIAPAPAGAPVRTAQPARLTIDDSASEIGFDASATLGAFRGRADGLRGWAELADTVTFLGATGRVEIDAASLHTGNGARDGHLRGELDVDRYPLISFVVEDVVPAEPAVVDSVLAPMATAADTLPASRVIIQGTLTVRDVERAVRIPAWVRWDAGRLHVRGRFPTRFTELGMKPPSRFLGVVRVNDALVLRFDATFRAPRP